MASRRIVKPSRSSRVAASPASAGRCVSGAAFTRPRLPLVDRRLRLGPDRDTNGAAPLALLRKLDLSGVLVVRERDLGVVRVLFGPGDLVAAVAEPVLVLP